jgi:hypothetical protein
MFLSRAKRALWSSVRLSKRLSYYSQRKSSLLASSLSLLLRNCCRRGGGVTSQSLVPGPGKAVSFHYKPHLHPPGAKAYSRMETLVDFLIPRSPSSTRESVSPKFHFPYLPPCAAQEMGGWKKSRNLAHWPGASAMPGLPGKVICLSLERSHFVVFRGQRFLWKAWYIYLVWAARNASSQEPLHRGYSLTDMNAGRKVSVSRPCSYLY